VSKKVLITASVLVLIFLADQALAQCAMCKQAAESSLDSNPNSVAKGLNTGILYLMAVPYVLILFIFRKQILALWRSWRGKTSAEEPTL
jgi:hypothetical protein